MDKFLAKPPLSLPFSLQFRDTPKSPQMVGPKRKHLGRTKINPPLPPSLPPPNQTHKSPLFSLLHFPSPTNYPNQKLSVRKSQRRKEREEKKKRAGDRKKSEETLKHGERERERERERTCGGEKIKRKKKKRLSG